VTAIRRGVDIAAAPSAVMAVLLDVEEYPAWQREISQVEVHERDDHGRPLVATTHIKAVGRAGSYTVRYSYPSPNEMTYQLVRADMMSRHDAQFAVAGDHAGCRLDVAIDLDLKWPVPAVLLTTLVGKGVGNMLDAVKRQAEERAR
jgi:ribosome-associated toxin RatA of RatAB toxin-antitoxin module